MDSKEDSKKVLVEAREGGCETAGGPVSESRTESSDRSANAQAGRDGGAGQYALSIRPAELVRLVPTMRPHIAAPHPTWFDIVEAACRMTTTLGIPPRLWGDACVALGRPNAALAVAVVASKPANYFTSTPAAYFAGMVARGREGTLNLDRSIWALRQRAATGDRDGNIGLRSEVRFPTAGRRAMEPSMCSREQRRYASG